MILACSPLRITLGGGGTDLASYYRERGGFLISAAISKYVYVSLNKPFKSGIYLKYSELERVSSIEEVKHNILREGLRNILGDLDNPQVEITTLADIPSGTGLGSSGSFTTAMIKGLCAFEGRAISQNALAELACKIEIDILKQPIGKQDQYAAAFGGLSCFSFNRDGSVVHEPLALKPGFADVLNANLLLFFTGYSRDANDILVEQDNGSKNRDKGVLANLDRVKEIGYLSKKALENSDVEEFGQLMHEHWLHKMKRSSRMSNDRIETWYELGMASGALGGKLVGAGGGGFLLFATKDPEKLRNAMARQGLVEVNYKFDFEGTKLIRLAE